MCIFPDKFKLYYENINIKLLLGTTALFKSGKIHVEFLNTVKN